MDVWYVDTSALVKLVRTEQESAELIAWLAPRRWVIGDLHRTELRRAARAAGPVTAERADRLLHQLDVIVVDGTVLDRAGALAPVTLRSLDALHLATAQALGPDLAGIVAYDQRLLAAADHHGIPTAVPG